MGYFDGYNQGKGGVDSFFIPKSDRENSEFVKGYNQGRWENAIGSFSTLNTDSNSNKSNDYILDTSSNVDSDIYHVLAFFSWILGIFLLFSGNEILIFIGIFLFVSAYFGDFLAWFIEIMITSIFWLIITTISFSVKSIINLSRLSYHLTRIIYFSLNK